MQPRRGERGSEADRTAGLVTTYRVTMRIVTHVTWVIHVGLGSGSGSISIVPRKMLGSGPDDDDVMYNYKAQLAVTNFGLRHTTHFVLLEKVLGGLATLLPTRTLRQTKSAV